MADRTPRSRQTECTGKHSYDRKRDAKTAVREVERRFGRLHAYRCSWCGGWHIGHRSHPET